jgi:hypothetical protein
VDTDYKEKQSKRDRGPSSCSSDTFALKEGHKEDRHHNNSFLPDVLFIGGGGGEGNRVPSPTTSQPCRGKNLLSKKLADGETVTEIYGDIMKLGNGTRRNLCPEMKSQR